MDTKINLLIYLVCFFIFTSLIYGQGRVNSKNSRWLKRRVLSLGGFFSKEVAEEFIRISYLVVVLGFFLVFLFIDNDFIIRNIFMKLTIKNLLIIVISFVAFIQILFLTVTVVYLGFLKKDFNKGLETIDWIKVNLNHFVYTGYIRTLGIAIFEVLFFFNLIFSILNEKFELSIALSMIITVLYYCYGKFILRRNKDKYIMLSILGFAISLTTLSLVNTVNSLLVGILFLYIILIMIAFKDFKVKF